MNLFDPMNYDKTGFIIEVKRADLYVKLEVAELDYPEEVDWNFANQLCQELGDGWRLPSLEELVAMYIQLHLNEKSVFETYGYYWSSTGVGSDYNWYFSFGNGQSGGDLDYAKRTRHLRLVRDCF